MGFLMPPHPLTNFEIQRYYQNEPKFNGVFSRNNLPKKIKDGAYVINLDEYADVGTHWIALFCNRNEIVYFDSFGVEHIPEEIKESIEKPKKIKSPEEDKNTTDFYSNWLDRNKFGKILAIIDSTKFNYKNKIDEFKYIDIRDLVNNFRDNTISEISTEKGVNKLNDIKNAWVKYKKRTLKQKELKNLFNDLLDVILTNKTLMSSKDEKEKENENEDENAKH